MKTRNWSTAAAFAFSLAATTAMSQVPQYGPNVTLEQAKKAIAAGQAEAKKNNWPVAIAIVDTAGMLVAFEKLDGTQNGSVMIAQDKAVSAAMLRRPTKAIQDAVAGGGAGIRFLGLRYASPVEGGLRSSSTARSSARSAYRASLRNRMGWWRRRGRSEVGSNGR
jgi:uncharacterized protein GlcG (DUF336 family)